MWHLSLQATGVGHQHLRLCQEGRCMGLWHYHVFLADWSTSDLGREYHNARNGTADEECLRFRLSTHNVSVGQAFDQLSLSLELKCPL